MSSPDLEQPDEQEPSLGFLAACSAQTSGNPMLESIRDRSAECVLAVYRLVKNALVHAIDNEAVLTTAEQSAQIIDSFADEVGVGVTITFSGDTIFVCGQLLRASRKIYEACLELGKLFARIDVSEVSFGRQLSKDELLQFAQAVATAVRDPERRAALLEAKINHVSARRIEPVLERRVDDSSLTVPQQVLRFYAVSLMVMREFYENVAGGTTVLPQRVKRISQRLVALAESNDPTILGLSAMATTHRDDAGRAVQGAVLAVVLGRQVTQHRVDLARLAMAALMADIGRARVLGADNRTRLMIHSDAAERRIPAATAGACLASGGVNLPAALRTVMVTESAWLERVDLLGAPFGGLTPFQPSQMLFAVRRLLERLAPRDGTSPVSPTEALSLLAEDARVDRSLVKLLVRALGIIPAGTVVEFETGEWAVVLGPSRHPQAWHMPFVSLVTHPGGAAMDPPKTIDLGAPSDSRVLPRIVRIVEAAHNRFNVTQSFLG